MMRQCSNNLVLKGLEAILINLNKSTYVKGKKLVTF